MLDKNFDFFEWMAEEKIIRFHYLKNGNSYVTEEPGVSWPDDEKVTCGELSIDENKPLFDLIDFLKNYEHEEFLISYYPEVELRSIIAIHNRILAEPLPRISDEKPALGGCRFWNYESFFAALEDAIRLSGSMTYKSAVSESDLGGAKSVSSKKNPKEKSEDFLKQSALEIDYLGGRYIGGEDMNCSVQDVETMSRWTRFVAGRQSISKILDRYGNYLGQGSGNPAPLTALGVIYGIKSVLRFLKITDSLYDKKFVIQGYGSVGKEIISILRDKGCPPQNICITDTDPEKIDFLKNHKRGVTFLEPGSEYDEECDIFAPCAKGEVLDGKTIRRLKCRAVAGPANNPLADPASDSELLFEKGIVYAPDFVINAGGLINVYDELKGYCRSRAEEQVKKIGERVSRILHFSRETGINSHRMAEIFARVRMAEKS